MDQKLESAIEEYISRKDRTSHPEGAFDKQGRWYPSEAERCGCCDTVRSPSRAYPYSYMLHCRTVGHIANLYGVPVTDLRKAVLTRQPAQRQGGENYYKLVAIHPETGQMVSVFNGQTVYEIGATLKGAARQDHGGGYYCYRSADAATHAPFPKGSVGARWEKRLIRVRAEGSYCVYDAGKLAFSKITPLEIVQMTEEAHA